MANIGTKFYVWLFASKVGADQFGNCYYVSKQKNAQDQYKRIVIYKGSNEPSKVPPHWHGWLHYLSNELPNEEIAYSWQKTAHPNLTGTKYAYQQPGKMPTSSSVKLPYEPWQPQ